MNTLETENTMLKESIEQLNIIINSQDTTGKSSDSEQEVKQKLEVIHEEGN